MEAFNFSFPSFASPVYVEHQAHYQKVVVALNETIRLMQEIDEVIERHGGWPGAFSSPGDEEIAAG